MTTPRPDDAHLDPALVEGKGASNLNSNTLLQEGGSREAGEADAAASAAAAARRFAAAPPADVDAARRVVARWRAFVAERKERRCPLLDLCQALPDLFNKEVLERLEPTDRTMLAQVGRPWLAAVLASGLPRLPTGVRVRLRLGEFCTSAERLAWARANGCHWGVSGLLGFNNPCALAAAGGHLQALQWAREHHCPWDMWACARAAASGHLDVLRWAREHGAPWDELTCRRAAGGGHLETLRWALQHYCPWDSWTCRAAAGGGHLEVLQWARAHGCPWRKWECEDASRHHRKTLAWVQQQEA
jgi:hypothetical protein